MSNAIEVLKRLISGSFVEQIDCDNALRESLLALKQKEVIAKIIDEPNEHIKNWEMAKLIHNKYEELSKERGWKTQEVCQVRFDDLPTSNKEVMVGIAEYIMQIELIARDTQVDRLQGLKVWLEKEIANSEKYPDTQEKAFYFRQVLEQIKGV